ncbi:MAG: type III-A CRISPR-associated RAMP protein Csm5 [Nitrospirae bacterium]|nr:MAG: type III-A CRISPR-associated RAMP protein Csm5 [Nitrospirota bacterium]
MATYTFTATPLTPIHVGTGETLDTSRYVVHGGHLVEVSIASLTGHLTTDELEQFTRLAAGSDLKRLRDFLRHRADPERDGIARMAVSKAFARTFEAKQFDPRNQLLVNPMTRNHQLGRPYLPGSAIKGALRTALVSCLVETDETFTRVPPRGDERRMQERALGFEFRRGLHEDPFRTVKVADALLPREATVVSRFVNVHLDPEKKGSKGIEAWFERLLSRADGVQPPAFTVEIEIDTERQRRNGRNLVGMPLTLDDLREAANRFYAGRFAAEWNRFHRLTHMKSAGALRRAFGANGALALPGSPSILLRVGRFSHFESLSVDNWREGFCPQAKRPEHKRIKEGKTRNLCLLDNGEHVPFGWLLLTPVAGDPAEEVRRPPRFAPQPVRIPTAGAAGAGGGPLPAAPRPAAAPRLDPEELARRQAMRLPQWLQEVKGYDLDQVRRWARPGSPRIEALREEFRRWQRGE